MIAPVTAAIFPGSFIAELGKLRLAVELSAGRPHRRDGDINTKSVEWRTQRLQKHQPESSLLGQRLGIVREAAKISYDIGALRDRSRPQRAIFVPGT
jgi:hypothetical protein